jgi:hypothetical protein
MSMQALGGMTPWQVLYGILLDLLCLKHFGKVVWVHDPTGSKLDPHAHKGHWISFDIESCGHQIYWPENKSVSVECSIYFTTAAWLKGSRAIGCTYQYPQNFEI